MKQQMVFFSILTLLAACGREQERNQSPQVPAVTTSPATASVSGAPVIPVAAAESPAPVTASIEPLLPKASASPSSQAAPNKSTASELHPAAPKKSEPDPQRIAQLARTILSPDGMPPMASVAYSTAKDIPDRLEKLYCYCHCHEDPALQHKSLLSCYQDHHAVDCAVCQNEAKQAWLDWKDGVPVEVSIKEINLLYNDGNPPPSTPIAEQ